MCYYEVDDEGASKVETPHCYLSAKAVQTCSGMTFHTPACGEGVWNQMVEKKIHDHNPPKDWIRFLPMVSNEQMSATMEQSDSAGRCRHSLV